MPVIYKRFTEKEARDWRQIYKALQLLEYLVKHGSERVVDDARSHLSMIKMLRNFHYVDEKGKDQGINVRNRSKELAELLSDLDRVRQERKKAKINKNKYGGVGNDGMSHGGGGGMSFTTASGSRYGGFGSDSLGTGKRFWNPYAFTRSLIRDSYKAALPHRTLTLLIPLRQPGRRDATLSRNTMPETTTTAFLLYHQFRAGAEEGGRLQLRPRQSKRTLR